MEQLEQREEHKQRCGPHLANPPHTLRPGTHLSNQALTQIHGLRLSATTQEPRSRAQEDYFLALPSVQAAL